MKRLLSFIVWNFWNIGTAMVGYHIHHSLFWSVVDFFFTIIAWAKWLVCHEVTMSVIRDTFGFFFN